MTIATAKRTAADGQRRTRTPRVRSTPAVAVAGGGPGRPVDANRTAGIRTGVYVCADHAPGERGVVASHMRRSGRDRGEQVEFVVLGHLLPICGDRVSKPAGRLSVKVVDVCPIANFDAAGRRLRGRLTDRVLAAGLLAGSSPRQHFDGQHFGSKRIGDVPGVDRRRSVGHAFPAADDGATINSSDDASPVIRTAQADAIPVPSDGARGVVGWRTPAREAVGLDWARGGAGSEGEDRVQSRAR
jgi:hypothetical protein